MDIRLGMHADNWRGQSKSFNDAVASAVKYNLKYLEAGTVYGYYFVSSLGYDPSLSILDNPYPIKRLLDKHGLSLSMLDASYPIFGPQGIVLWHPVLHSGHPLRKGTRCAQGRQCRFRTGT